MLDTFPGLTQIEQMVTPKDLGTEIMKQGTGQ